MHQGVPHSTGIASWLLAVALIGVQQAVALNLRLSTWEPCGQEDHQIVGIPVGQSRLVRFGWGETWTQASLADGAICDAAAFAGVDPLPHVQKACECLRSSTAAQAQVSERVELDLHWRDCAAEGESCTCSSGLVRFGSDTRWAYRRGDDGKEAETQVPCSSSSFPGEDPAPNTPKRCWCAGQHAKQAEVKVGVVLLSRRPADLGTWLQYHIRYMGVEHVFMQVEDTPEFNATWAALSPALHEHVTVWYAAEDGFGGDHRPFNDYESLQQRQEDAMMRAKELSQHMGLQWLFHIDDDELLYTPLHRRVGDILAAIPSSDDQVYVPNVEAVYESPDVQHCFEQTAAVNMNAYKFSSYANGKAAVRVTTADTVAAGPHQWRDSFGQELPSFHLDSLPFGPPLILVHYESCPFTRWEEKFWELGNTIPARIEAIPFPFYRESIKRMQHCRGLGHGLAALLEGRIHKKRAQLPDEAECSVESLRELWSSYKSKANTALTREDLMTLAIPWQTVMNME
mmetsp:Transcript_15480/g.35381  ORF Transcript_15480/g.35381 Transcript_15480/m.35381 type:complete len:513 (+) Transcript_15480:100-1638(+)